MRVGEVIGKLFSALADRLTGPGDFTCGDCERSARCGLPPHDDCLVRAAQLERGDWKLRRQARRMLQSGM